MMVQVGKEFDALLIDVDPSNKTFDIFQWDSFDVSGISKTEYVKV